jgi:CheY-like chemotaxis protein
MLSGKPVEILLVEDNPADVRLTIEALKDAKVYNQLNVVSNGADALTYLRRQGPYTESTRPDLILLDLNLPKMGGLEVLDDIKNDPELRQIPVVVVTTSQAEQDIIKSYNSHANCYICKPVDLDQFITVIQSIQNFWLTIVKLP